MLYKVQCGYLNSIMVKLLILSNRKILSNKEKHAESHNEDNASSRMLFKFLVAFCLFVNIYYVRKYYMIQGNFSDFKNELENLPDVTSRLESLFEMQFEDKINTRFQDISEFNIFDNLKESEIVNDEIFQHSRNIRETPECDCPKGEVGDKGNSGAIQGEPDILDIVKGLKMVGVSVSEVTVQNMKGEPGQPGKAKHGLEGIPGRDGMDIKGETGSIGISGVMGEKGEKGDFGSVGLPGLMGIMGPTGDNGLKGFKGDDGDDGKPGIQGPPGI